MRVTKGDTRSFDYSSCSIIAGIDIDIPFLLWLVLVGRTGEGVNPEISKA